MTTRYVGPGGNDGNSGLTWALRKLTLNGVEDTPVAIGDVVYVGPGVYREELTVDISGGSVYSAGTVTVTNGSTTVTGAGTAFLANVAVADLFHVRLLASGNDGVVNGTPLFTSAAGNFQASMIGMLIQINTEGCYRIGAVAAANSITLIDINGIGHGVAAGLTYSVMSGEGQYEIVDVPDNTTLTLAKPWTGPTCTGLAYIAYTPITYIGDVTGENTDGVGGIIRITGSDNDQVIVRNWCIEATADNYRTFRGFHLDSAANDLILTSGNSMFWVIEDCTFENGDTDAVDNYGTIYGITVRRCRFLASRNSLRPRFDALVDDSGYVVENCVFSCLYSAIEIEQIGGITVKGCTFLQCLTAAGFTIAPNLGQITYVRNCIIVNAEFGVEGAGGGYLTEDYNNFYSNNVDRLNVAVGPNSQSYPALLLPPILYDGLIFPWIQASLNEWSQIQAVAGLFAAGHDLHGLSRPVTAAKKSWGAVQFTDMERDTGTVRSGVVSMVLHDAGRHQIWVPVTNAPTTFSVYVYREANYAGNNPQMIVKQPGQADDVTTDAGAAGAYNLLTTTLTPAADPSYVVVELVSRNTAAAGNYATFFEDIQDVPSIDIGDMETWLTDRLFWFNLARGSIASPIFGQHVLR